MNSAQYGFRNGWLLLPVKLQREVKTKIALALNIKEISFYARLSGKVEPTISEAKAIEEIFKKYGIKDVWGNGFESELQITK